MGGEWLSFPGNNGKRRVNFNSTILYFSILPIYGRFISLVIRLRWSELATRSLLSVVWLFLSLTGGTPRKLVRHHRSGVQKKQDDTRQSSNGRQSRSPPTYVITELQTSLDLRKIILTGNNPDGPASCCCKFLVVFSLPVSSAARWRVLCRKTIGAGTSVRLGFPNARPVVFDERSEEFRRSVKESLSGPVQANRSDGIKPEIGIDRKK